MQRRQTFTTLYVPTLRDADGLRHIIPGKDRPAYCSATGEQEAPRNHQTWQLCQRCVQKYMRRVYAD